MTMQEFGQTPVGQFITGALVGVIPWVIVVGGGIWLWVTISDGIGRRRNPAAQAEHQQAKARELEKRAATLRGRGGAA
jgi:hypothetical protein